MTTAPVRALQLYAAETVDRASQLHGHANRWIAPATIFDVAAGFGEQAWLDAQPVSILAIRLRGAPVRCHWGRFRGQEGRDLAPTFQPRGAPNHFSAAGPIRFAHIYLADALVDRVACEVWSAGGRPGRLREDLIFLDDAQLGRSATEYLGAARDAASPLELEARAILLVARLLRQHHAAPRRASAGGGLTPWQMKRVCDAMAEQLAQDIGLEALAAIAGVSATHLSRAFKQTAGVPPFTWLRRQRIQRARELLGNSDLSLAEIAAAVGFGAQPQFTTAFLRETGTTPGAWRRVSRA